jgi:polyferredoxin
MNTIRRAYYFCLTPFIMLAAVILFILDNLNVNVAPFASYMMKEAKRA